MINNENNRQGIRRKGLKMSNVNGVISESDSLLAYIKIIKYAEQESDIKLRDGEARAMLDALKARAEYIVQIAKIEKQNRGV